LSTVLEASLKVDEWYMFSQLCKLQIKNKKVYIFGLLPEKKETYFTFF